MALGNNLKRIKKDSLIPKKKEQPKKGKAESVKKTLVKPKAKPKAKTENKPVIKSKIVSSKATTPSKPKKEVKVENIVSEELKIKTGSSAKPNEVANLNERIILGRDEDATITAKLIPSRRKTVRKTKLIFEGSLSLMEAKEIKECLLTTFIEYDVIDIELKNITHLDIIPIQLINMFIDFYSDKKIKVDADLPFDMKIIVDRAGFGSLMFKEEAA